MTSGPSDFPLDGIELSTAVGHWTIRVRAIERMTRNSRIVVTLQLEGTPPYQVRLHFPRGGPLPTRADREAVAGLLEQLREWIEAPAPKLHHLVVGEPTLRGDWRRPEGGFPYTIVQGFVQMLVPPEPSPAGFEATLRHLIGDPAYQPGMGILYDRRLAPAPTVDYLDAVVAMTHTYGAALGRCRWAVLVRKDDAETFGLVRKQDPVHAIAERLRD